MRLVSYNKQREMTLCDAGHWHHGREAERRATPAEHAEYERLLLIDQQGLPWYDQATDTWYYLGGDRNLLQSDIEIDLVHLFGLSEAVVPLFIEAGHAIARVKAYIDAN
ncbi:MAG: hypothetical protein KF688_18040 [Pirellulales bacterium]|nr:hypothetical protein [Pirellulales bacterium]